MFNFFKNIDIDKVCADNKNNLLKKSNVWDVMPSKYKYKDGKIIKKDCIMVFVNKKQDIPSLMAEDVIPKEIDGVQTDVYDLGGEVLPMTTIEDHRKKIRPVVGGISAIVEGASACSLGLIVYKNGKKYALTNDHCVSFQGQNNLGKKYLQQSPADGGGESIGKIISEPIIKKGVVNKIDSAIVELEVDSKDEVLGINYVKKWSEPEIGTIFDKVGRTTGITTGIISHKNVTAMVNYGGDLGVVSLYPCLYALQNNYDIVNGGDSGSCIFNKKGEVIGQTFAAAPNLAIFMPIKSVIEELGIELTPPQATQTGFLAINSEWFNDKEILINGINFRSEPKIANNILKKLNKGNKINIIKYAGFSNNYHWLEVNA